MLLVSLELALIQLNNMGLKEKEYRNLFLSHIKVSVANIKKKEEVKRQNLISHQEKATYVNTIIEYHKQIDSKRLKYFIMPSYFWHGT